MCGIAGMLGTERGCVADAAVLRRMCDVIAHRGPDDDGYYVNGPVGLGKRRLSIIDLAGGHQPMSNETGDIWLVFNGEIWNYKELRKELIEKLNEAFNHDSTEHQIGMMDRRIYVLRDVLREMLENENLGPSSQEETEW